MTLDHLRSKLEALEDAVREAGYAWLAAEQAGVDEADLSRLLQAYGVYGKTKREWLRDGGELLRWHRGEAPCASAQNPEQDTRELDLSNLLLRIRQDDDDASKTAAGTKTPVKRAH